VEAYTIDEVINLGVFQESNPTRLFMQFNFSKKEIFDANQGTTDK